METTEKIKYTSEGYIMGTTDRKGVYKNQRYVNPKIENELKAFKLKIAE
jgi:hypothetical protein